MDWMTKARQQLVGLTVPERVFLLAPVAVWFSYAPNFHIMRFSSTNIEVSITLLYLCVFMLSGMTSVWRTRKQLFKHPAVWLGAILVMWQLTSLFWTVNVTRGLLQVGVWCVLWCCFLVVFSMQHARRVISIATRLLIISATGVSILAILQVVYGAWTDWGLCAGCLARGFGFVRPSVFAIEPQFLGSLLILPTVLALHRLLRGLASRLEIASLLLMIMALYLTLSRGALFAIAAAVVVLSFITWRHYAVSLQRVLTVILTVFTVGCSAGMAWHGLFTELNPRVSDGWYDAVAKSVNHLTLGKVSLPKAARLPADDTSQAPPEKIEPAAPQRALFDGYVQRSTDERTTLNTRAIHTWSQDPLTVMRGVGVGGAGRAMYQFDRSAGWEFEIVQNEYLSVLLELGVIGLMLFLAGIIGVFWAVHREPWMWAVLAGFLVQWNFFSGLPNALHIYLTIICMVAWVMTRGGVYAYQEAKNLA